MKYTIKRFEYDKFSHDYATRIMEVCGWSESEAIAATEAMDDKLRSEYIDDEVSGSDAADDEIECWSQE